MYYNENGELSWGFKVPAGVKAIEWFKLLLLNYEDLQKHLQNCSHINDANESLRGLGMTAVQLVGEYLKVLWNHALGQIYDAKGQNIIDGMPFLVVLTVPAIWTNYARERMREAAEIAGILKPRVAGKTTLTFISEPEAAAIATIPELDNRGDLLVGDTIVVVDAGGGTVDIISYRVNKLEPLSMSECVEGEGDLCGGTFLDNEFEKLLKTTVGMVAWSKMNGSDIRKVMNNEWEHGIKQAFDGDPDYYTVELPNRVRKAPLRFST
ncbi:putative actin-like atpase domain-containing protein [Rosellinia necatrix]|uniref:Putative actin-like atpase domain-containing protein n=1 Tax=Rosellinia necatrix TaxID=77044 RepID=A0A1W2TM50_ROSNE|nr:putative actin-like atpase domain-containing protein [Rosellinia necatrix]